MKDLYLGTKRTGHSPLEFSIWGQQKCEGVKSMYFQTQNELFYLALLLKKVIVVSLQTNKKGIEEIEVTRSKK